MTTATTTTSSVDLLNKYAGLGDAVNEARRQHELVLEQTQTIRASQTQLEQQERQMQASTVTARDSLHGWNDKLASTDKEYRDIQLRLNRAKWKKERAQQALHALRSHHAEQRQAFLDESMTFQQDCKRLRLEAAVIGLNHAAAQAHALVNGGDVSVFDGLDAVGFAGDDDNDDLENDDPLTWTVYATTDDELQERLHAYRTEREQLKHAQELLADAQAKKQAVLDRITAKHEQHQQLQAQLDRIGKDNDTLESQIQEVNNRTEEAEQLAASMEKNARARSAAATAHCNATGGTHHSASSVTPSPASRGNNICPSLQLRSTRPAYNPYARSNNKSSSAAANGPAGGTTLDRSPSRGGAEWQESAVGHLRAVATATATTAGGGANTGGSSLLQRQHPHRAGGRIRRNRQFGTGLCVTGGEEATTGATPAWSHSHEGAFSNHEHGDDDDDDYHVGASISAATTHSSGHETPIQDTGSSAATSTENALLDILNDDDDDELLGFVAFPQTK